MTHIHRIQWTAAELSHFLCVAADCELCHINVNMASLAKKPAPGHATRHKAQGTRPTKVSSVWSDCVINANLIEKGTNGARKRDERGTRRGDNDNNSILIIIIWSLIQELSSVSVSDSVRVGAAIH